MTKPILTAVALILSGCAIDRYTDPSGATFARYALFTDLEFGTLEVEAIDNGKRFRIDALKSDQIEAARAIAQGVAEGVTKGIKP